MQVTASSTLNCVDAHFGDAAPDAAGQQDAQEQDSATGNGGATSASTLKERLPDSAVPACIVLQLQGKPQQQTATAAAHGQPVDAFGKVGRGRRDAGAQCADASTGASPAVSNAGGAASGAGATNQPDAANQAASSASVMAINGNDHDVDYRGPHATAGDLAVYAKTQQDMSALNLRKIFQADDPHHHVIGAFLDGTWNSRPGENLADTRPGRDYTNVGLLQLMSRQQSKNFQTQYFRGVGTDPETKLIGGATGAGVSMRVADAYQWITEEVNAIHKNDPNAAFDFLATGFSRGALEARMLLREIDQRGIPDYASRYEVIDAAGQPETRYARNIVEPGQAGLSAVLFDTVTTGIGDFYNVDLPARAQVYHPIARDEMRQVFPSAPLAHEGQPMSSSWFQPVLAGDHSDIGNNHDRGGLGDLNLQLAHQFMTQNLGLPMKEIPSAYKPDPANMWIHDMRGENGVAPTGSSSFVRPLAPGYVPPKPWNLYQG